MKYEGQNISTRLYGMSLEKLKEKRATSLGVYLSINHFLQIAEEHKYSKANKQLQISLKSKLVIAASESRMLDQIITLKYINGVKTERPFTKQD